VASLDAVSTIVVGMLVGGMAYLVFVYARRYLSRRRHRPSMQHSVKVSDARLYSGYQAITTTSEGVNIVRELQETSEEYARRMAERLAELGMARLGETYLHARFRDAVPASLVEELDRLEPEVLSAIEQLKESETVRG
jgi:hypothetical protein